MEQEGLSPLTLAVAGVAGKMGQTLARLALETEGIELTGATERDGHPWVGMDLGSALGLGRELGVAVSDDAPEVLSGVRALVDFTAPEASTSNAELAAEAQLVHVIGTTGFEPGHLERIRRAAKRATIIRSGNMSLGVNLLAGLARQVSAALGGGWDAEIVEIHHGRKVDAPSGTALLLGEAVAEGRNMSLEDCAVRGRDGYTGPRKEGSIGFAALRGGDVVGEHDVIFAGAGERVILRHVATERAIYARGAMRAAIWGRGRAAGEYTMADVLGLSESDGGG